MKVNSLVPLDETARDDPRQGFQILCRLCSDALQVADRLRVLGVGGSMCQVHTILGYAVGLLMQMNERDVKVDKSGVRIESRTFSCTTGTVEEMKELSDGFL